MTMRKRVIAAIADRVRAFGGALFLRHRLTLLILAVLTGVGGGFIWLAHHEVQRALRLNGLERAAVAARQVSALLTQSAATRTAEAVRLASDPQIQDAIRSGNGEQIAGSAAVRAFASRNPQVTIRLYSATGTLLQGSGEETDATHVDIAHSLPPEGVSPLRMSGGRVSYFTTARIAASAGDPPLGFLSIERTLRSAAQNRLIERLIGDDAKIKLGNADGALWTDLTVPTTAPPVAAGQTSARYESGGEGRLGAASAVDGTPWSVWADVSEAAMLAPASVLAGRMVPITLLFVAVGAVGAFVTIARATRPIEEVADAAHSLASGDFSRRVVTNRGDEVGRLANAFNEMAAQIANAHAELEARVSSRTRELEAFSYSVSHDLRAPLRHITGFVALLQGTSTSTLTERDRRYLDTIAGAASRMTRLVEDLLAFSRMGREEVRRATVDLNAVFDEVMAELAPDLQQRQITWTRSPLPTITADRALVKVVFTNLLSNAVKYTAGRPVGTIEVGATVTVDSIDIFVRDNGAGFDMKYVDKLFGVFQRLHSADEFEGTGIGLANVRRIMHRHGGRAWAEGETDRGATFYVSFPGEKDTALHASSAA